LLAALASAAFARAGLAHHLMPGVEHGEPARHAQAVEEAPLPAQPRTDEHGAVLPDTSMPPPSVGAGVPGEPEGAPGGDGALGEWQSEEDQSASRTEQKARERVTWAAEAYEDLINASDRGVPERLLEQTRCIAVIPQVVKGAFFFGARYGKGVLTCRNDEGAWSPLVFITLAGPSVGFQWGAQSADVVLFFRRESGVQRLLESQLTLGADASIAAGPVGRRASAEVDVTLATDILSYARSRGAFLGISLEGSYLGVDSHSNAAYYGRDVDPDALLFGARPAVVPQSTTKLLALLP
jgi:lipid-binding SYLF domain-containing protein